jgi:hypothetical protein
MKVHGEAGFVNRARASATLRPLVRTGRLLVNSH